MKEELQTKLDPYAVAGSFVFNWDNLIEPAFNEGNFIGGNAVILESLAEFEYINKSDFNKVARVLPSHAYASYRIALGYLRALAQDETWKGRINLGNYLRNVGVQVDRLDMILQGDEVYDLNRRRN